MEKETEKIEMGSDPQESFAEMNVNGYVEDGVEIEIHQLEAVEWRSPWKKEQQERSKPRGNKDQKTTWWSSSIPHGMSPASETL